MGENIDNGINNKKNVVDISNAENVTKDSFASGNPNSYSALTLAYIGDCVYELYVRSHLIESGNRRVNELHKEATKFVKAKAQADFYRKIEAELSEEEAAAFHRGRNTKSHPPKNANVIDYKVATGVETLIGYLYVKGEVTRISELMIRLFER